MTLFRELFRKLIIMNTPRLILAAILLLLLTSCATSKVRPVVSIKREADFAFKHQRFDEAATQYEQIVDRYPGDWQAQYRLGQCLMKKEQWAPARRALEVAHTRRPNNDDITDALAEAMYQHGDETGLFAFLRERADSTRSVTGYLRLAHYAVDLGDPDSAKSAIDRAIVLDDGRTVEPYLAASSFAEMMGNLDEAVRRLAQAYGIEPGHQEVVARLQSLGEVPGPTIALAPGL